METFIIEYAAVSPAVLSCRIEHAFNCVCRWRDVDEDFFEFSVFFCRDLAALEDILAEFM